MTTPHHRNPCTRGHEIYNFGRGFLAHHYYIFSLSARCTGVKKIFKQIQQFYTFYPQITSPLGGGSWNLQFLVSLPYRCYISNLVNIGPVVLEKKMLTHDDGRQPIAIGHLSDSGDLKNNFILIKYGILKSKFSRKGIILFRLHYPKCT